MSAVVDRKTKEWEERSHAAWEDVMRGFNELLALYKEDPHPPPDFSKELGKGFLRQLHIRELDERFKKLTDMELEVLANVVDSVFD